MNKVQQLQAAFDDAKQTCLALPADGRIEFVRGHGYYVYSPFERAITPSSRYCWLGSFDRGMCFLANAKERRIPNFAMLRVGTRVGMP